MNHASSTSLRRAAFGLLTPLAFAGAIASAFVGGPAQAQGRALAVSGLIAKPRLTAIEAAQALPGNGRASAQSATAAVADANALHTRQRSRAEAALAASGLTGLRVAQPVGRDMQRLDFDHAAAPAEVTQAIARLMATGAFEFVEPNTREQRQQAAAPPNDPFFTSQWWLQPAGASPNKGLPGFQVAWLRDTGDNAPVVAVLDTGLITGAARHPDLPDSQLMLPGYDLVSDPKFSGDGGGRDPDPSDPGDFLLASEFAKEPFASNCPGPSDSTWHGTIIAGIVAAATGNGVGVAGALPRGRVLPVRVAAKCGAEVGDIIDGMRWAAGLPVSGLPINRNPAQVVNISYGSPNDCGEAYRQTIADLAARGVVVVAAAGNDGGARVIRPANCAGVVAVGAVNRDGYKTPYANVGPELTVSTVGGDSSSQGSNGALADGGVVSVNNVGATGPGTSGYAQHFGTSFSTPMVSAAVALMLSRNPALSVNQVIAGLRGSARPHTLRAGLPTCGVGSDDRCNCTTATCGTGLLDVPAALTYAENTVGERKSDGGGALEVGWLAGLGLAVWAVRRRVAPRASRLRG